VCHSEVYHGWPLGGFAGSVPTGVACGMSLGGNCTW
jgi:hypothetical protein